jgi:pyruvate,water dikinase
VPEGVELVRRFKGRVYFDLTLMQWTFFDALGVLPEVVTRSIGGHQPIIEVPPGDPFKGPEGRRRLSALLRLLRALWSFERKNARVFHRHVAEMRSLANTDFSSKASADLKQAMRTIETKQWQLGPIAGLANSANGRWLTSLEQLLQKKLGGHGISLLAALSSASGENVSAEQGYRIMELARIAKRDVAVARWLNSTSDAWTYSELSDDSPFRIALEQFLSEFGHRATGETNILQPRWAEDCSSLLRQIRDCMNATSNGDPRDLANQRRLQAAKQIRKQLPLLSPLVLWMVNRLVFGALMQFENLANQHSSLDSCRIGNWC